MMTEVRVDGVYAPSADVVVREIEGELIIVPLTASDEDAEGTLYTLNESGRAIWGGLDGSTSLRSLAAALAEEYEASPEQIQQDAVGLMEELLRRKIVEEVVA